MKGKRREGTQKKRLEDYVKEWARMDGVSSTRTAENRTRWKGVVVKSSVVTQQPCKVMDSTKCKMKDAKKKKA